MTVFSLYWKSNIWKYCLWMTKIFSHSTTKNQYCSVTITGKRKAQWSEQFKEKGVSFQEEFYLSSVIRPSLTIW